MLNGAAKENQPAREIKLSVHLYSSHRSEAATSPASHHYHHQPIITNVDIFRWRSDTQPTWEKGGACRASMMHLRAWGSTSPPCLMRRGWARWTHWCWPLGEDLSTQQGDSVFSFRYITFLAELVASDKPADEKKRDCNRRVVVHSSRGEHRVGHGHHEVRCCAQVIIQSATLCHGPIIGHRSLMGWLIPSYGHQKTYIQPRLTGTIQQKVEMYNWESWRGTKDNY